MSEGSVFIVTTEIYICSVRCFLMPISGTVGLEMLMCLLMFVHVMSVDFPVEVFQVEVSWEEMAGDNLILV